MYHALSDNAFNLRCRRVRKDKAALFKLDKFVTTLNIEHIWRSYISVKLQIS